MAKTVKMKCPKCGGTMYRKKGNYFIKKTDEVIGETGDYAVKTRVYNCKCGYNYIARKERDHLKRHIDKYELKAREMFYKEQELKAKESEEVERGKH